jgi:peptide/nickel transport system substrate-binding protein
MKARRLIARSAALAAVAGVVVGYAGSSAATTRGAHVVARPASSSSISTFVMGTNLSPSDATLDPSNMYNQLTASPIEQGLLQLTATGKLAPLLATSVSQPSPAVYVFHLRHDVKFSDGTPMTSADVVTSFEYYHSAAASNSDAFQDVKSVVANGPYTVTITLKSPDAAFEQGLAWQGTIFEKAFYEAHKKTFGAPGTLVVETGPWKITSFTPNVSSTFVPNPYYWGGKVNIQNLTIKYFSDETSEALAFRTGQIDVAFPTGGTAFQSTCGCTLKSTPATSMGLFGMNTKSGPWANVYVRRAVAYSINRTQLIKALGNPAIPVSTVVAPSQLETIASTSQVNALLKSLPSYPYNLAKAKAELAKSPYPHGFSTSTDTTTGSVASEPVSEAIAGMVSKIGIKMKVNVINGTAWINELVGPKKYPDDFTTFNVGSPDPSGYPSYILGSANIPSGGWNWAAWNPPGMNSLLTQSVATVNPAKRLAVYGTILKQVAEQVPYIAIFMQDYNMALSTKYSWPEFNQQFNRTNWELQLQTN